MIYSAYTKVYWGTILDVHVTWSLIPGPSWEWVHQLTCSQTVCASSCHGVRVHRLRKLELFHNLGIEGLYHGDIMVFCCALNGNQPTLYTNTHVVLFHLLKESVIWTPFTPSIQKSVAHNIKMRVSLLTHSSLVSQILSILSTELVMKMPVSWGYHCTIEMAWDSVLVTALFHKCPSVWSKRDITFLLLHPFYPECFLFPFLSHTSVGVTTRYSTLTGARCISEPQPFLPSSFLPPSLFLSLALPPLSLTAHWCWWPRGIWPFHYSQVVSEPHEPQEYRSHQHHLKEHCNKQHNIG